MLFAVTRPTAPCSRAPKPTQIQLVPNLVEMFCRAFLSEQASSAHAGGYGTAECQSSGDCPPGKCPLPGALEGVAREECVRGRCACPSGFHHIALGVGLERCATLCVGFRWGGGKIWSVGIGLYPLIEHPCSSLLAYLLCNCRECCISACHLVHFIYFI